MHILVTVCCLQQVIIIDYLSARQQSYRLMILKVPIHILDQKHSRLERSISNGVQIIVVLQVNRHLSAQLRMVAYLVHVSILIHTSPMSII